MINIDNKAQEFWQHGYLSIDNFFDAQLMDKYQQSILMHFGDDPDFAHNEEFLQKSNTDVIPWFPQLDGLHDFDIAEQDQRLINLTKAILGPDWNSLPSMIMFSKKGSNGQAWHQDCHQKINLNSI